MNMIHKLMVSINSMLTALKTERPAFHPQKKKANSGCLAQSLASFNGTALGGSDFYHVMPHSLCDFESLGGVNKQKDSTDE